MSNCILLKAETHYHAENFETLDFGEHCHPWHEVTGVVRGIYEVDVDGQRLRVGPGHFCYFPPGHPHSPSISTCGESVMHLLQWTEDQDGANRPRTWFDTTGRWLDTCAWLTELSERFVSKDQAILSGLLQALLTEFDRPSVNTDMKMSPEILRLRIFLRTHFQDRHSLADLAKIAHMSREGLLRRYQREVGLTPMADLRNIRLEAARRLLRTNKCTQTEAAKRCGFSDASHLNRLLIPEILAAGFRKFWPGSGGYQR